MHYVGQTSVKVLRTYLNRIFRMNALLGLLQGLY